MGQRLIEIHPLDGGFRLEGDLDLSNVGELAQELERVGVGDSLYLDCSGLRFIDSTGLHVIVGFAQRLEGRSRLTIRSPSKAFRRMLKEAGVERLPSLVIE